MQQNKITVKKKPSSYIATIQHRGLKLAKTKKITSWSTKLLSALLCILCPLNWDCIAKSYKTFSLLN